MYKQSVPRERLFECTYVALRDLPTAFNVCIITVGDRLRKRIILHNYFRKGRGWGTFFFAKLVQIFQLPKISKGEISLYPYHAPADPTCFLMEGLHRDKLLISAQNMILFRMVTGKSLIECNGSVCCQSCIRLVDYKL